MTSTFYVSCNELGRIQYLVRKHNLRWVPGYPWERFRDYECKITGDVNDFNRFDAELEEIRSYDHVEPVNPAPWWKRLLGLLAGGK